MPKPPLLIVASPGVRIPAQGSLSLMPGQLFFGSGLLLRTLLGSCVSITLWHPQRLLGGMCHFMLPGRQRSAGPLDGRYGDEALELLVQGIQRTQTRCEDYIAHLYGGADTMPSSVAMSSNVGERNIEQAWLLIDRYGFQLDGVDVGERVPRHVSLDLVSGQVSMKRGSEVAIGRPS